MTWCLDYSGADWPVSPGSDRGVYPEAPERRRQAEGQGAAADGFLQCHEQRREFAQAILQDGKTLHAQGRQWDWGGEGGDS